MTTPKTRVLIADDSGAVRKFVERALLEADPELDIIHAGDGRAAVESLSKQAFDIAFVDINMPQFDGVGVTAAVQMLHQKTLCISMSSDIDESTSAKLKSFGAYDFLPKPFSAAKVQNALTLLKLIRSKFDVLIVDDSATVRRIVMKVLERSIFDLEVVEAVDGADALDHLTRKSFRLVFSDFNMPGMTGIELAREIKRIGKADEVILMSTEFSTVLDKAAQEVGAKAFLRKPFYPEDVDTILHHVFGLPTPHFSKHVQFLAAV